MTYKVIHKPSTRWDIVDAVDYYKVISPKLAEQFLFRLEEAKKQIARIPLGFQIKYKHVRTLMLKQFPYKIHYIIDDAKQQIIILAIVHSYRNPTDYSIR